MLFDKSFYDYDYEKFRPKLTEEEIKKRSEIWSDDKVKNLLAGAIDPNAVKKAHEEELQEIIRADKISASDKL